MNDCISVLLYLQYNVVGSMVFGIYLAWALAGLIFLDMDQAASIMLSMAVWTICLVLVAHGLGMPVRNDVADVGSRANGVRKEETATRQPSIKPKRPSHQISGILVV
jgi:hypothetical protein